MVVMMMLAMICVQMVMVARPLIVTILALLG
ncbi:protein of unknown function (plasmid) [Cupriavidus neocaledonicus]|uniref:Uncharacterized protein n=1 Tax=Cupriavidus neocaledonicus TaxID=1040979 RepID=A0A375HTP1_9BURK|nr:hypothetical protein CBM2605_B100195 [Cupriavidus neocaledonicus]SPD60117.1 protein of unknown function [Cupriavidus neocaledonicus]